MYKWGGPTGLGTLVGSDSELLFKGFPTESTDVSLDVRPNPPPPSLAPSLGQGWAGGRMVVH